MKKAHKQIKNNKNAKQMHYNIHVYGLNCFLKKKNTTNFAELLGCF